MTLDLHELSIQQAIQKLMTSLLFSEDSELEIITGKGTGALIVAIENLLTQEGYDWHHLSKKSGSIIFNL